MADLSTKSVRELCAAVVDSGCAPGSRELAELALLAKEAVRLRAALQPIRLAIQGNAQDSPLWAAVEHALNAASHVPDAPNNGAAPPRASVSTESSARLRDLLAAARALGPLRVFKIEKVGAGAPLAFAPVDANAAERFNQALIAVAPEDGR